jgi:hypothetical protein
MTTIGQLVAVGFIDTLVHLVGAVPKRPRAFTRASNCSGRLGRKLELAPGPV